MKKCPNNEFAEQGEVFGIFDSKNHLTYLDDPIPISQFNVKAKVRISSSCETKNCDNWNGKECLVPTLILNIIEENLLSQSQYCSIRNVCRWYSQEGIIICEKCPLICQNFLL